MLRLAVYLLLSEVEKEKMSTTMLGELIQTLNY
jgi:hypothetical protein